MRIRVVLSGIFSGAICLAALWYPWFAMEPAGLAPDWPYQNRSILLPYWVPTAMLVFCGLTIFIFGWVSARWNWAGTWRASLLAGAGAGSIAGCLIYDFIGAFHFGLMGQSGILKVFYAEVSESRGIELLIEAIAGTALTMYPYFLAVMAGSIVLGGLGGVSSAIDVEDVWGKPPRDPDSWLFRLPGYTLTVSGFACMIVALAGLLVLQESAVKAAIANEITRLDAIPIFIVLSAYVTCLLMILLPMSLTWGWIIQAWKGAGLWRVLYGIWVILTLLMLVWLIQALPFQEGLRFVFGFEALQPMILGLLMILVLSIGVGLGLLSRPVSSSLAKYKGSDWVGYALAQGILGGTQVFVCLPAYALVLVLISIVNIPHLVQAEVVESTPTEQMLQLFNVLVTSAQTLMLACAIGGFFFGLIILLIRKFLKIKTVTQPEGTLFESYPG